MSDDRKTITISEAAYEELKAQKQGDDTFDDVLQRLLAGESNPGGLNEVNTLQEEHIPDIANAVAQQTAQELETRRR
jgi:predicted CopG family antitoxin